MEYAAGGELFDRIVKAGRFSEDEARYFFQQLISGVEYCHSEVIPCFNFCTLQAATSAIVRREYLPCSHVAGTIESAVVHP